VFAQDVLPEYDVEISAPEWAAITYEFLHRPEREAQGLDPTPYHPIELRYQGSAEAAGVMIRLKGDSSWAQAVELDPHPKMQFVISFNEVDRHRRFHGLRKVELDMPRDDFSFLRQRLALWYMRSLGIPAQCANSARLVINGRYYGLYTALERMDKEFLQRKFPGASDGDLWEGGRVIKTNEDTFDPARNDAFWAVESTAELAGLADLDASVRDWAALAMIPDTDSYYGGHHNYMLYDHPTRGFLWLPHDLDATFDYDILELDPIYPDRVNQPKKHYLLVMHDPAWVARYVEDLRAARAGYDLAALEARVDAWSAQIATAAAEDEMKPFAHDDHLYAIQSLHDAPATRAAYVDAWLDCREHGGPDADGDGAIWCRECDDTTADFGPAAAESCNLRDDDCDGYVDEHEPACPPPPQ